MTQISIITINRNNSIGLEKTIRSVVNQTLTDLEYIIIDGASSDTSVEVIRKYESSIYYWVSEPDNGIYNAMNKGITKASGEYCLFLNSGDVLVDEKTIENIFLANPTEDIVYGDMFFGKRLQKFPSQLNLTYLINRSLGHGSTLIKRDLFEKCGYFEEQFKIVADWEFFLKAIILKSCSYRYLQNVTITRFNMDGISSNPKHIEKHQSEKISVFEKVLPELIDNDSERAIIAEALLKLSLFENSKLVHLALSIENSRLFVILKKLYHSV